MRSRTIGGGAPRSLCVSCAVTVFVAACLGVAMVTAQGVGAPQVNGADVVAIMPFTNITGHVDDAWIGAGIAETLAVDLQGTASVRVVAREAVSEAMSAIGTTAALEVGRHLGVRWLVTGGYQRLGDWLRITARLVAAETGAIVQTAKLDGAINDLFTLQDRLAAELTRGLPAGGGLVVPSRARAAPPVGESVPAGVAPAASSPNRATAVPLGGGFRVSPSVVIDGPPSPVAPKTIARDGAGRATVRAVRLPGPWRLDGTLDEGMYEEVPPVSGFIQQLPDEGQPATERTDAWVFYDAQHVYVGARLWDSAPESQWLANEMQRDSMQLINNESFSVMFDTFYDRRNGVVFFVNPIGGFMDYEITDEGFSNIDWNPIWDVRTGRFDGGWTVEMEIPFKSLRYRPGASQIWGLQLGRSIRWKNEQTFLTLVSASAGVGALRVSAAGTLTGVEVQRGNRTFEVKPYAIGSLATDLNAVPRVLNEGDGNFGVDVKYGVTQNLTADFTYNTDFAQVEVDAQQVNLTRFSLFFPEKREFFLEGRGIFDFGRGITIFRGGSGGGGGRPSGEGGFSGGGDVPTLFFSRRIGLETGQTVPILGGGRLTGKAGKFSIGGVNIQTDDVPGANARSTNFTVLRAKRDILRRSRIGGIFTRRSVSTVGDGSNEVYGLDAAFSFYDNVNFNGYYARTRTHGLDGDDASYQGAFSYTGDLYGVRLDHLRVGDNFNPEIGFLRRDDFRRTFTSVRFSPRPTSIRAVRQFTWEASFDYFENGAGQVATRLAQARFETELENSDRFGIDVQQSHELLVQPFAITSDVTIPVGAYDFQDVFASYSLGGQRRVSGTLSIQRGEFFSGHITAVGYRRGRIEVTPQLSIEPSISINRLDLPEGAFTTKLVTSRVTYTLTPRMFVGVLLQYNSARDSFSTNLRLRWEYQPGSELFVVYNDQRDTTLRGAPMLENRAFIVKFTRLFRF